MRFLTLDCATETGWALFVDDKYVESGVQSFKKKRSESNGFMFLKFRAWVNELILTTKPDVIGYEMAHFRGGAATEICVGLQSRVQEAAAEVSTPYKGLTTSQVKVALTGKGRASKEAMIAAAEAFIGHPVASDDEADAIAVGLALIEEFSF